MSEIPSGYYETLPIEAVIAAVKDELKIETADFDSTIERWINQGAGPQGLRTLSGVIKHQCTVMASDGKAKLPRGFSQLIAARFNANNVTDDESANTTLNCVPMLYVDMAFISNCGCNSNFPAAQNMAGVFQINNGYMIFYGEIADGTEISVAYFGTNVDANGMQVIYARYERALVAYACSRYTLQNAKEYNQYVIEKYNQEWMAQKRMLRSEDAANSFKNTKYQMMEIMNALIVDKNWATQITQ